MGAAGSNSASSHGDVFAPKVNSFDYLGGASGGGVSSPTFQFSKETEKFYKEKYPKFYDFVMNILPKAINDEKFISILSKTSGFSIDELAKMFSSDSAYGIIGYQEIPFSIADYPHGDRPTQFPINLFRLNNKTLDWFESANIDTTTFEGIRNVFQMVGYVGHEINH